MAITPKSGLAYGVFKCSDQRPLPALIARFKEALENIKGAHDETGIPPNMEFQVFDAKSGMEYAISADNALGMTLKAVTLVANGANLVIRSELPDASNATAGRDLGDAMNMLYGGTELFDAENAGAAKRVMDVFYRNDAGEFVSQLSAGLAEEGRG
ncbi:MAG: hypothetical protein WC483_01485 [Candidatus Paceibacterota bacterium]